MSSTFDQKIKAEIKKITELWPFENIGFVHLLFLSYLVTTESSSKSDDVDLDNYLV